MHPPASQAECADGLVRAAHNLAGTISLTEPPFLPFPCISIPFLVDFHPAIIPLNALTIFSRVRGWGNVRGREGLFGDRERRAVPGP